MSAGLAELAIRTSPHEFAFFTRAQRRTGVAILLTLRFTSRCLFRLIDVYVKVNIFTAWIL